MVVFDTSFIALAFDSSCAVPLDPLTGAPMSDCSARVQHLIDVLTQKKERVLIPTPVLAEYLVRAGKEKDLRLQEFMGSRAFRVAPFDVRAAAECALLFDRDLNSGKTLDPTTTKAKVKFDRQIVAIAKVQGAERIYTGDNGLAACANANGIDPVMTWEIPTVPVDGQISIAFEGECESDNQ